MDQLQGMRVFRRVVDSRGFAAAARELRLSVGGVSKLIRALENHLGVQLLNRTTRRLSLTEVGEHYYTHCVQVLEEMEQVESALSDFHVQPKGILRLNVPVVFGMIQLSSIIPEYMKRYPEVTIDLTMTDRFVDLVDEGYDLALRITNELDDSSLIAVKLARLPMVLCASPAYLKEWGIPKHPQDLKKHRCLVYSLLDSPYEWEFKVGEHLERVRVKGSYYSNNGIVFGDALVAGVGITLTPEFMVRDLLRIGKVKKVMTQHPAPDHLLYAVYPEGRHLSAKVRSFIDFIKEKYLSQ